MVKILLRFGFLFSLFFLSVGFTASAQGLNEDEEFGPVVRAYLGYLRNEQNVVDDRASRHEVNRAYYIKNSNRIRALRQMAIRIALESHNDYLPELEAVAGDELGLLFEQPPRSNSLRVGEVLQTRFRYLGTVRAGDVFHVFARLDPYEQSELMAAGSSHELTPNTNTSTPTGVKVSTRARRVGEPR
jgi:hypothetical protein